MANAKVIVPIGPMGKTFHGMPAQNSNEPDQHTVTVHLPGWAMILEFAKKDPAFFAQIQTMYPRFGPHKKIKALIGVVLAFLASTDPAFKSAAADAPPIVGLPYPSLKVAQGSVDFVTASPRTDGKETVPQEEISVRAFEMNGLRFWMTLFPLPRMSLVISWWQNTGTGISSRFAEDALQDASSLREVNVNEARALRNVAPVQALQQRVAHLIERAPVVGPPRPKRVQASDVYIYTSGMTAICAVHESLLKWSKNRKTVLFGLAFNTTVQIFEHWGPGVRQFPFGTELEKLEAHLKEESEHGTPVQAVWTEFPSNPLLVSADLWRLRDLADKYKFALVVDETISSFCSVDVVPVADIIVSSLTKSFNGYADAICGSAVLNAHSALHSELKPIFDTEYGNDFYARDAQQMLANNEDYFPRSTTLNGNAEMLVDWLHKQAQDSTSPVKRVYYPSIAPTKANYNAFKRPASADFAPGYGCLFSVELEDEKTTIAFYDNLKVHQGPHLGAHRSLAMPYTKALYHDELEKVAKWDLRPTQIRISVGLEPADELLAIFEEAVKKARAVQ